MSPSVGFCPASAASAELALFAELEGRESGKEVLTCAVEAMLASGPVDMSMTQGKMGWKHGLPCRRPASRFSCMR